MWNRRAVLQSLLRITPAFLTTRPCALAFVRAASAASDRGACALGRGANPRKPELLPTTGNPTLDGQLVAMHEQAIVAFRVDPGFGIIEDSTSPNAWAIDDRVPGTLREGKRGTVLLGVDLTLQALADSHWGAVVVQAVVAHEAAHIVQFNTGLYDRLKHGQRTDRPVELHADYLAGYYLGMLALEENLFFDLARQSFYLRGDTNFHDPSHHGTPDERTLALSAGFETSARLGSNITAATSAATLFVRSLRG